MDISAILNIPILQALAVIVLIGVGERMGIPFVAIIKALLKINGNGNYQGQIEELKQHAKVANDEMGDMRDTFKAHDEKEDRRWEKQLEVFSEINASMKQIPNAIENACKK